MNFKIMLLMMSFLVIFMAIYSVAFLNQVDVVVIINSSAETQTVEYSLTEFNDSVAIGYTYQEDANVSYNTTSGSSVAVGYLYINYTKPSNAIGAIWQTKHGTLAVYNTTLSSSCWNAFSNVVVLRMESRSNVPGGSGFYSNGQCHDGSNWILITQNDSIPFTEGYAPSLVDNPEYLIDGDYSTHAYWSASHIWDSGGEGDVLYSRIYEEALFWGMGYNIEFEGKGSNIKYLTIPTNSNVTFAKFNVTGFYDNYEGYLNYETANETGYSGDIITVQWNNIIDGDWDTFGAVSSGTVYGYYNYTPPNSALNTSLWQVGDRNGTAASGNDVFVMNNLSISECWNSTKLQFRTTSTSGTVNWSCYNGSDWYFLRQASNGTGWIYEEAIWWHRGGDPYNVTIDIGNDGDVEFNTTGAYGTGIFNTTNQTIDFRSELNDCRTSGTPDSNGNVNCEINISSINGKITINEINITYDYNITYLFIRNDSYTFNESINVIPNTKYKRRFSIQPTSDLLSNDLTISGYYTRNGSPSSAEINNEPAIVNANDYYELSSTINKSQYWPLTYIWDSNCSGGATGNISINISNSTTLVNDVLHQNFSLFFRDADDLNSEASAGVYKNSTLSWNYNSTIGLNEKIEVYISGTAYDITPSSTQGCPDYERKTASTKVYYTCLNRSDKYASVKVESSS